MLKKEVKQWKKREKSLHEIEDVFEREDGKNEDNIAKRRDDIYLKIYFEGIFVN